MPVGHTSFSESSNSSAINVVRRTQLKRTFRLACTFILTNLFWRKLQLPEEQPTPKRPGRTLHESIEEEPPQAIRR